MDDDEILTVNKFTRTDNSTGLYIDVYPANNIKKAVVSAKVVDSKNDFALWGIDHEKWLMTTIENVEKLDILILL